MPEQGFSPTLVGVPVPVDHDAAVNAATALASAFAAGASARDAERRLPVEEIEQLSASGLLAITVPREFGGPGLGPSTLAQVVAIIAAADPSIAQIPQSHFTFLEALRRSGSRELREWVFGRVLAGGRLANAQNERTGKTVTDDSTTVTSTPDGLRLGGTKYYCTGAYFADILAVRAVVADEQGPQRKTLVYLPADTPGIEIVDDWDGFGQRTTSSGTVTFTDVAIDDSALLDFSGLLSEPSTYGARAQLVHAAIDVGIARGALGAAAEVVTVARPWFESGLDRAVDDPYLIAQAGELELSVRAAESLLETAARRIEEAQEPAGVAEASLATAAAKIAAGRAARDAAAQLFDFGGTRSASGKANWSRFWRDARTHTLHDPERWKVHHLGRWALAGQPPPSHTSL